jgi:hypothetical protein
MGYGANQKTCYSHALQRGADVVVMVHADHQYDPTRIPAIIAPILAGEADMMMGTRIAEGKALEGGMPLWKFVANRALTTLQNAIFGQKLTDLHTGFRAYSRQLLEEIPWYLNSNDFVFDSQMIAQAVACGFRLGETPVPARYFDEASSVEPGSAADDAMGLRQIHRADVRRQDVDDAGVAPGQVDRDGSDRSALDRPRERIRIGAAHPGLEGRDERPARTHRVLLEPTTAQERHLLDRDDRGAGEERSPEREGQPRRKVTTVG